MYSEDNLISRFFESDKLWDNFEYFFDRNCDIKWKATREYALKSNKRIDVFFRSRSERLFFVVEAKVYAKVSTIKQAHGYRQEFYVQNGKGRIQAGFIGLLAQYFDQDCLFVCEKLGIPCLQVVPTNQHHTRFISLVQNFNIKRQLDWGLDEVF